MSLRKYSAFVGICFLYILKMHGESSLKICMFQDEVYRKWNSVHDPRDSAGYKVS
jgi:hypothetical protein